MGDGIREREDLDIIQLNCILDLVKGSERVNYYEEKVFGIWFFIWVLK